MSSSTPAATGADPSLGARPSFVPGSGVLTITDALRVRSRPEVSEASTKYEPTLPIATELHVLAGPMAGSGYWWYRVELPNGVTLYHGAREGWVAAAARDGTPWIDSIKDVDCYDSCPPPWPTPVSGWPTAKRGDLVMSGEVSSVALDEREDLGLNIRIAGLLPGSTVDLAAVGEFDVTWECFDPEATPDPTSSAFEGGLDPGPSEDLGKTKGSATAEVANLHVDSAGVASGTLTLRATQPAQRCAAGWTRWSPSGQWAGIRITEQLHGLVLTPETQGWETWY